jgi:hypothetical protein
MIKRAKTGHFLSTATKIQNDRRRTQPVNVQALRLHDKAIWGTGSPSFIVHGRGLFID